MKPEERAAEQYASDDVDRAGSNNEGYRGFLAGVKWARESEGWTPIKERLPTQSEYERGVEWRMVSYRPKQGEVS